jgi:pimeloyl-ACP methyl ester carboxylesterase
VVLFHGAYGDHDDMIDTTQGAYTFAQTAKNAGYIVMMHDGGWHFSGGFWHNSTYGSEAFQRHTEAAIKSVLDSFGSYVDRERIYGYGFSMGGGNVLTYAARHLDPTAAHGMLAAVVDQSSQASTPMWYVNGGATFLTGLYGSSYAANPFVYRRASVIDSSCAVGPPNCLVGFQCGMSSVTIEGSMAQNLFHLPVHTFYGACEPDPLLVESCHLLDLFLGGSPNYATADSGSTHAWSSVAPVTVLRFFDPPTAPPKTLSAATLAALSGDLFFAEDNRREFHFQVKRVSPNDLGRIHWTIPAGSNDVLIEMGNHFAAPNVEYVTVFLDGYSPLDPVGCLRVYHHDYVQIHVKGYTTQPAEVFKGPNPAQYGTQWTWVAATQTLVLNYDTSAHTTTWRVAPTAGDCP